MIRHLMPKTRGMHEADMVCLVQAFIIFQIMYAIPYALLTKEEIEKVDAMIRKAYKQALGLPISTAIDKLLKLGPHNMVGELTFRVKE